MKTINPLPQDQRPACSIPLSDADLSQNNSNWTKGLQAMSDWIWSANLNQSVFPNNLGKYLLQIPGIFEQQLNFSTTLIFDEPSFKNGIQISGFVDRICKELAIQLIAQTRRSWYTMTHHAILGKLTADKHGLNAGAYTDKIYFLTEYRKYPQYYTPLEIQVLDFVLAFATNQKSYADRQFKALKEEFREYNRKNYKTTEQWISKKEVANFAKAEALSREIKIGSNEYRKLLEKYAALIPDELPDELNDRKVNAQIVELSFLCLQFVALSCVFTGLNIPDETFLPDVMTQVLPEKIIERLNELNELGLAGNIPELIPPRIEENGDGLSWESNLFKAVVKGQIIVKPASLKGSRIPLVPFEGKDGSGRLKPAFAVAADKDKGVTVGGVQTGVYGWSFGGHFPGSLPYCLMHHPELSRFEPPYSLPLLFNEDEWRNGVQTAGYISRKIKELVIQKVYRTVRTRYGIEHHTMFMYNTYLDEYGLGRNPNPNYSAADRKRANELALQHAEKAILYIHDPKNAPKGTFSRLEEEILTWTEELLSRPHQAYKMETRVREALKNENENEIKSGLRILDTSPGLGNEASMLRLINHQISELAMVTGHMDGLGRLLSILRLETEDPVQVVEGKYTGKGGIKPDLDKDGQIKFTGFFNNRPGLGDILNSIGVSEKVLSVNELCLCPSLCKLLSKKLEKNPNFKTKIDSNQQDYKQEF